MSAISRVFWTPELFESIFLHLDVCDILRIRHTNRYVDALISSPQLQRKIFKRPETLPRDDSNPLFYPITTLGNIPKLSNGENVIECYERAIYNFLNSDLTYIDHVRFRSLLAEVASEVSRDHWDWARDPSYRRFCIRCLRCHRNIRNDLVHPLFRGLTTLLVCISGRGTQLLMTVRLDYFYHLVLLPGPLGMLIYSLRDIIEEFQHMVQIMIEHDLKWDMLTRPVSKQFLVLIESVWTSVARDRGMTVSRALAALGTCLERYTRAARDNATGLLTAIPLFDPRRTLVEVLIATFEDAHLKLEDVRRDWEVRDD
ncbi:hypothetical protein BDV96DRAFT_603386 [Lophiotrema nucula]|uniref:F-box domain-containing protein n=1 Tax=Lophiotrema nucula TaxID=690887 RepID=A0A6A5YW24_9PLEO|nr:hypothetical protein BDV96DRAFT_603386 [Lophiotrema nucula]